MAVLQVVHLQQSNDQFLLLRNFLLNLCGICYIFLFVEELPHSLNKSLSVICFQEKTLAQVQNQNLHVEKQKWMALQTLYCYY